MKIKSTRIVGGLAFLLLLGCQTGSNSTDPAVSSSETLKNFSSDPQKNMRISLTDAPKEELSQVFVNIKEIELFIKKGQSEGRVRLGVNMGTIDLLLLRNGVMMPIEDFRLAPGTQVSKVRMILNEQGHSAVKKSGSQCAMQTPSAQQTGIKISLAEPFTIEEGRTYSMVLDFDAGKSVVLKGNGGCLLKPVLKLMKVVSQAQPQDDSEDGGSSGGSDGGSPDGSTDPDERDETQEDICNDLSCDVDEGGDFHQTEESDDPPVISIEDSYLLM